MPVDDRFQVRLADYDRPCGAIIIPNPNAPTGIGLPFAGIEALLAAHPDAVVVMDEAYIDFGGESAIPLISTHPNLLVIQTLSKSRSLAGLRIDFALGAAAADRGAGAGQGQFQFLSARSSGAARRDGGDQG